MIQDKVENLGDLDVLERDKIRREIDELLNNPAGLNLNVLLVTDQDMLEGLRAWLESRKDIVDAINQGQRYQLHCLKDDSILGLKYLLRKDQIKDKEIVAQIFEKIEWSIN